MYTSQVTGDTYKKILDDIQDCFDSGKTGLNNSDIKEIVYCHTSSNLKAGQDKALRDFCKQRGVLFASYGVDTIAHDLYNKYPAIARDELSVSIDTGQILSDKDFVGNYNKNVLAAPLDTVFQFRETEISKLFDALNTTNVVIISGQAGVGKTRLGLEVSRKYIATQNACFYCIRSNGLPVYEDLKSFLSVPGKYVLLVDDANQLTGLEHIVEHSQKSGYDVKIIITVREYAKVKVVRDICEIVRPEVIQINKLKDEEIGKLIEENLGILNKNYIDKITRIAEGNARIAMLAGKIALEANRLDSINDASQLYENYYGKYLYENNILQSNKNILSSAGIVAFLGALHLEHLEALTPVFEQTDLTEREFVSCLKTLHDIEIVDIYNDKAVRFSEQCLSNYLIKHVFVDQNIISLNFMIKHCFTMHKERVINAVNVLGNVFSSEQMHDFIQNTVKDIWKDLKENNDSQFFDFVMAFYRLNTTETLIILKEQIDAENIVELDVDTIDFDKKSNNNSVDNKIIQILSGYADMNDLDSALDLLFTYLKKRPDLFMDTYFGIINGMGVSKDSERYGYYTQIHLIEKFYANSDDWTNHLISIMFIRISKTLLKLVHESTEGGRGGHSLIMYTIPLSDTEGAKNYRNLIWGHLMELSKKPRYHHEIGHILEEYGSFTFEKLDFGIIENDIMHITKLVNETYDPDNFRDCLIIQKLRRTLTRFKQDNTCFSEYKSNPSLLLLNLLSGERYEYNYKRGEGLKLATIKEYISSCDSSKIKEIIDVCVQLDEMKNHDIYMLENGLAMVFLSLESNPTIYIDAIKYYLSQGAPLGIYPNNIVSKLFEIMPEDAVYALLNSYEYNVKNTWIYAYFYCLPETQLKKTHLQSLYDFLETSEGNLTRTRYRPLDFISKYETLDKEAFVKCCRIIANKMEYSPFIVDIYFGSQFSIGEGKWHEIVSRFHGHYDLLSEIYVKMLTASQNMDYEGSFLSAIYTVYPQILEDYMQDMITKEQRYDSYDARRLLSLWRNDDYVNIMDKAIQYIFYKEDHLHWLRRGELVGTLLGHDEEGANITARQDEWLTQYIRTNCDDKERMRPLFDAITSLPVERRKQHILNFIKANVDFDAFRNIPLEESGWGGMGSMTPYMIPYMENRITFLEGLLPHFVGVDYLQHKQKITEDIDVWQRRIENEQIEEMLRG